MIFATIALKEVKFGFKQNDMKIGDKFPQFELLDSNGQNRKSTEFQNGKHVVVFFYPKDNTPGCTTQVCSFRDAYEDFIQNGCEVIGVSSDSVKSHALFSDKFALPYPILSDDKGILRKQMRVPRKLFGLIPGRVTYIFNPEGNCIHITNDLMNAEKHVEEALEVIKGGLSVG